MKIGPLSSGSAPGAFRVVTEGLVFHCGTAREAAALGVLLKRAGITSKTSAPAPGPAPAPVATGKPAAGADIFTRLEWMVNVLPTDGTPVTAKTWYGFFTVRAAESASAGVSFSRFQDHMAQLVVRGLVTKSGIRRGTRYARGHVQAPLPVRTAAPAKAAPPWAGARAVQAVKPAGAKRAPQGRPAAAPPVAESAREGEYADKARKVLAMLADGQARTFRELRAALGCGGSAMLAVTQALQATRQIVRRDMGTPCYYQLPSEEQRLAGPQARSVAVQAVTDTRLAPVVARVFLSGASYDLREIHRTAQRGVPEATLAQVTAVVDGMVRDGKLAKVPLGSITRYQQRAKSGQGTLSDVEAADLAIND